MKDRIRMFIKKILSSLSPRLTTQLMYKYNFGKKLDLKNPKDINEKLQYLKLNTYYNNSMVTRCVDKYEVRNYLTEIGKESLLPTLIGGPFYNTEDLSNVWDSLPQQFVIKCNHGCGYNILVSNKDDYTVEECKTKLTKWLNEKFWKLYCEPQYKYVKPAFIIEQYLGDDIATYKFYCFNGEPEAMYISSNGENGEKDLYLDYYDMDMNWIDLTLYPHLHAIDKANKPQTFEQMKDISRELSRPFPFVRIDLYSVCNKVYFSEFTFIPTGGNMKLTPSSYLTDWGNKIQIS